MSINTYSALSLFWITVLIFSFKIDQSISFGLWTHSLIGSRSGHTRCKINSTVLGKNQTAILASFWEFLSWIPTHLLIAYTSRLSFLSKSFVWTYLTRISQFSSLNLFTIWSVFSTCNGGKYVWYIYFLSVYCFSHLHWVEVLLRYSTVKSGCHFIWRAFLLYWRLSRSLKIILNVFLDLILKLLLLKLIELLNILNNLLFLVGAHSFQTIA